MRVKVIETGEIGTVGHIYDGGTDEETWDIILDSDPLSKSFNCLYPHEVIPVRICRECKQESPELPDTHDIAYQWPLCRRCADKIGGKATLE